MKPRVVCAPQDTLQLLGNNGNCVYDDRIAWSEGGGVTTPQCFGSVAREIDGFEQLYRKIAARERK
jgi:hypothetical protein